MERGAASRLVASRHSRHSNATNERKWHSIADPGVVGFGGELGVELEFKAPESLEQKLLAQFNGAEHEEAELTPRPPIVKVVEV